ncbi:MAG: hypothetical protein Q7U73_00010 [Rubrivivax sp.]|nr:hypothetical protein [Rubrivivax sp.]
MNDSQMTEERAETEATRMQQAQPLAPKGFAIVPLRMTREMEQAIEIEGWQWEDLLAAAEAITEEQYADIQSEPSQAVRQAVVPAARDVLTKIEWLDREVFHTDSLPSHDPESTPKSDEPDKQSCAMSRPTARSSTQTLRVED